MTPRTLGRTRPYRVHDCIKECRRSLEFWLTPGLRQRVSRCLDEAVTQEERFEVIQALHPGGAHQHEREIVPFLEMLAAEQPRRILEVGMGDGGTTLLLSRVADSVKWLCGIDLFVRNRARIRRLRPPDQHLFLISRSSTAPRTRLEVSRALSGDPLDLAFIDGDHSYAGVRADFEYYGALVRPGGLIALHDVCEDHLTRFGVSAGGYAGDVPRFWQELRARAGETYEFVDTPGQDGAGIGVVRVARVSGPQGAADPRSAATARTA